MTVPAESLKQVGASAMRPSAEPIGSVFSSIPRRVDLARVLVDSGIEVHRTKSESDGRIIFEVDCLTSTAHDAGAFFTQFPEGGVAYNCHHASCMNKAWKDVRDRLKLPSKEVRSLNGGSGTGLVAKDQEMAELKLIPPARQVAPMPILDSVAYSGLAGDVVRAIAPTSEADPVAILTTFLVMYGNACGRKPSFYIGDTRHGTNINTVLVGDTSRSRKGTSADGPRRLMMRADPEWAAERVQGGLSSGEGLIWAVHDDVIRFNAKTGDAEITDPGVADKRLLAIEEEMSQVLKTAQRQGATISEVIRCAWDARPVLQTMTKTSPSKATDAHISILGHITKEELLRQITETDLANGFANRFMFIRVSRSKLLPNPVGMSVASLNALGDRISECLAFAQAVGTVVRDSEAEELWALAYAQLERDRPGLAGAITARSSPIVLRIALIYALLDKSDVIQPQHLEAALAIWDYADASVSSIFGDLTGDTVADRIFTMLRSEGSMTRNDITDAFSRNVPSSRIGQGLDLLHQSGRIRVWREPPGSGQGRHRTIYEALADRQVGETDEAAM